MRRAAVPALLCAAWTVAAGKDLNWDLLNYHYYAPYQLLGARLAQDFFAASAQSYLNPVGYLPFYLMVSWGWHSVLVSVLLALAHGSSLLLLYAIARRLFQDIKMCLLATALGASSAVFWATVGTSFLDPLLVAPMLAGLLLLLDRRSFAAAGVLFGAAAALKYSNAIYALAAAPLALLAGRRAAAAYVAGGAAAVAALAGPWLWLLAREFGHPFYPGLSGGGGRFAPHDLLAALLLPFRMVLLDRSLYAEIFAPDIRFAALGLLAIAFPLLGRERFTSRDRQLLGFFALAYVLWVATSANSRYGLLLLLLAGLCVARLAQLLLPARAANVALALLLVLQLALSIVAAPARWYIAEPWSKRWFPYEVPERARREPALYLTLETQPMAVIAPFLHPGAAFVNLRGQRTLSPDEPRLAALLERHRQVRWLGRELDAARVDAHLALIGYRLERGDCFAIEWRRDDGDALSRAANWLARTPPATEPLSLASCALQPVPRDPAREAAAREASALFDRVENNCRKIFRGQSAVTEPFGASGWARHYVDLDARLETFGGRVLLNRYRAGEIVDLAHCQ